MFDYNLFVEIFQVYKGHNLIKIISFNLLPLTYVPVPLLDISVKESKWMVWF